MQSGNDVHKNQRGPNLFYCKIAMIAFVETRETVDNVNLSTPLSAPL